MVSLNGKCLVTRRIHICAAHRLHSIHLSDEENKRIYGKCNHIHGHGHNYIIKISVAGDIDSTTGMVINLVRLKEIIQKNVTDLVDHKNLDKDVDFFHENPSTVENICVFVWKQLVEDISKEGCQLIKVKICETENCSAVYTGGSI